MADETNEWPQTRVVEIWREVLGDEPDNFARGRKHHISWDQVRQLVGQGELADETTAAEAWRAVALPRQQGPASRASYAVTWEQVRRLIGWRSRHGE
jgi:hypothetical protein